MIALFHEKVSDGKDRVTVIHYKPERLPEESRAKAILIEDEAKPEPETRKGKKAVLYVNPQTKVPWYEYEDSPLSQEDLLAEISGKLTDLINLQPRP